MPERDLTGFGDAGEDRRALVVDGCAQRRDDGPVELPRHGDTDLDVGSGPGKKLEQNEIDPCLNQVTDLLPVVRGKQVGIVFTPGKGAVHARIAHRPVAEGRGGSRDKNLATPGCVVDRVARNVDRGAIPGCNNLVAPHRSQNMGAGGVGVGGDDVGAGADVVLMDRAHDLRMGGTAIGPGRVGGLRRTAFFKLGAVRTVQHDRLAAAQSFDDSHHQPSDDLQTV